MTSPRMLVKLSINAGLLLRGQQSRGTSRGGTVGLDTRNVRTWCQSSGKPMDLIKRQRLALILAKLNPRARLQPGLRMPLVARE
jgi:hypothetical protein